MKILPVQSYTSRSFLNNRKTEPNTVSAPVETTVTAPEYGRALVNFKGVDVSRMQKIISKIPLEDKFAVALGVLEPSELVIAANNLKKVLPSLIEKADKFDLPIKRLYFIQDEKIKDSIVIHKQSSDDFKFININDRPLGVNLLPVVPGMSTDVTMNSSIRLSNGFWFHLKEKSEAGVDLLEYLPLFMREVDFTTRFKENITRFNKSIFKDLEKPQSTSKKSWSFADVGGQDKNIEQIKKHILYPLKYPEVYEGFMVSRGVVLAGLPGTGKSLLCKALVGEAGASSFEMCATDFSAKYVGESEQNMRDLFQRAIDAQPSIICLDEINALTKARGGQDVHNDKLLEQFLSLMSDIEKNGDNVFVIGSTNRIEDIDPAVLRSGRFGLTLEINPPDLDGVRQILDIHTQGKRIDKRLDKEALAQKMYEKQMTGADIAEMVTKAFSHALERSGIYESMEKGRFSPQQLDYFSINLEDFEKAISNFKGSKPKRKPIGFQINK